MLVCCWCLAEILKSMLSQDSDIGVWSRLVWNLWTQPSGPLCLWHCFNNEIPKVSTGRRGPDGPGPLKRRLYLQCSLIFISFCDYHDFHHSVHRIDDQGDQANKALHSKDIFRSVKINANQCKSFQNISKKIFIIHIWITMDSWPPIILVEGPSSPQRQPLSQNWTFWNLHFLNQVANLTNLWLAWVIRGEHVTSGCKLFCVLVKCPKYVDFAS